MQIVVRKDMLEVPVSFCAFSALLISFYKMEGWGVGPLMAQTAHATAAVGHAMAQQSYISSMDVSGIALYYSSMVDGITYEIIGPS
jgi:hypothetical protein